MPKSLLWLPLLGLLAALPATAGAQPDRVRRLENSVLAPCCYAEPVSRHQSEIAMKMRLEIARWVQEGRSDEEILGEYTARYGAKVLVDPNSVPRDWSYLLPWSMVVAAGLGLVLLIRHWRAAAPVAAPVAVENLPDLPPEDD